MSATCKSCGAPIRWVTMDDTGRKNPLDAAPVDSGNVAIYDGPSGEVGLVMPVHQRPSHLSHGGQLYLSHFATCRDSAKWRQA